MKRQKTLFASWFSIALFELFSLSSCCSDKIETYSDGKYLPDFHQQYYSGEIDMLEPNQLALFVDYSTCNVLGQHSRFYQALVPSWTNATKTLYSIKGDTIVKEEGSTYTLLKSIVEVNFANLKAAVEQMAELNTESVLLTDGEYYQQSLAKGNINNPYMADGFKKWLLRGHDIYFISEPYQEPHPFPNGQLYNKKRFYILFTDSRLKGNIYERITQTVRLDTFPEVDIFHLSVDHPSLMVEKGNSTIPNQSLNADVKGYGNFEVQEWPIDWEEAIEPIIVNAVDSASGTPLEHGEAFSTGLKIDRNSFGGYKITNVIAKVYDINQEYSEYANIKDAKGKVVPTVINPQEYQNFVWLDETEFEKHGIVNLHFDAPMYNPTILTGCPFNYFKVDINIFDVQNTFSLYEKWFEFDSIDMSGEKNVSVAESIKQCLADPDLKAKLIDTPVYSIYVKSPAR